MRAGPVSILSVLLSVALLPAIPARAGPQAGRAHHRTASHPTSDMDRTLARMAARDRSRDWRIWQRPRPLARVFAPATRERVAAPPFTGWGYGGTIPGARPGF
jgi:hypothetical protein